MCAINIKAQPQDESQVEALKAFMKALKIKFEISEEEKVVLSDEQQKFLDSQLKVEKALCTDAGELYDNLKTKYGL